MTIQSFNPNSDCIRTFQGHVIDPLNPDPDKITIVDIAHALSFIPRFNGHTQRFYSVAEHSIEVWEDVRKEFPGNFRLQLAALLHDASEAYLLDIPTPVKKRIPGYKDAENNLMKIIAEKFGFSYPLDEVVTLCDKRIFRFEWINLMQYGSGACMTATPFKVARERFMEVFDILTSKL